MMMMRRRMLYVVHEKVYKICTRSSVTQDTYVDSERENKRDNSIITNSLVNDFIDYGFLVTGTSNNVLVIG